MNVVDSSAWLEYFTGTPLGAKFADVIENTEELIVPSITIFEVYKKILNERGENAALKAAGSMRMGTVVDLTTDLALSAAHISKERRFPMADSIILATARAEDATLWTLDSDFKGVPDVRYFAKKSRN